MRKRDVVVGGGVVLLVVLANAFLLTGGCNSLKSDGCSEGWPDSRLLPVLVVTQEVPSGQSMDSLVEDDLLKQIVVPPGSPRYWGAATDVSQLKGKTTTRPIGKDEQITLRYLT